MGIAGEEALYDFLVPGGEANVKVEKEANRYLWFLLARATGSPAVGVVSVTKRALSKRAINNMTHRWEPL